MDIVELLHKKRIVAALFDAHARETIRLALRRRIARLEQLATTLSKDYVGSHNLAEQLCVLRGPENEAQEEAFPELRGELGVLAAFMEITPSDLKAEADRRQGDMFGVLDKAHRVPEPESEPEGGREVIAEWVQWRCGACDTTRSYPPHDRPGDDIVVLCPFCVGTMRPIAHATIEVPEKSEAQDAPGSDAASETPEAPETSEAEPGTDEFVEATIAVIEHELAETQEAELGAGDPIRAQRLGERPEFRSRRAINALQEANIYTVGQLLDREQSPISIGRIRGLGKGGHAQVQAVLAGIRRELAARTNGAAPVVHEEVTADVAPEHADGLPF